MDNIKLGAVKPKSWLKLFTGYAGLDYVGHQLTPPFTASAIILGLVFGSFAILANLISLIMVGKINERVPESERISYFWWGTQVRRKYKQLYPESKLTLLLDLCVILMVVCFAILIRVWVLN
jgi:hypothetical protein